MEQKLFLILDIINYENNQNTSNSYFYNWNCFCQLDKNLFYYSKSDLRIYHLLPLKINPQYRPPFEGGFALRDEDGFTIAAKGNTYPVNKKTILINKLLKYGFNEEHLVAIVTDSDNIKYYVKFNQDRKNSSVISATMDVANKPNNLKLDKWIIIDNNDDYIYRLTLYRNYSIFIIITLVVILTYKLVRYRETDKRIQHKL